MMVLYTNVVLSLVLTVCGVFSQQQPGLADILTLLVNSVGGQGLGLPAGQQQSGPVDIPTLLATNNGTSQQQPQLANLLALLANNGSGLPQLDQQPGIASILALLTNGTNQVSALSTTLLTLLFESLSLTVLTNNRVSDACQTDMIVYIEEIFRGNQWALKMLDATGKPGADLADGMTKFIGSYEECVSINAVSYTTQTAGDPRIRGSFNGKYCSAFFDIPGAPPALFEFGAGYVQLGVCVPDSCADTDVHTLVAIVERLIFNQTVLYPPRVKCREENEDSGVDVIVCVVILSLLGGLVVVGTLYDVLTLQNKATGAEPGESANKDGKRPAVMYIVRNTDMENKDVDKISQTKHSPDILSDGDKGNDVKSAHVTERGTLVKSLLSFSIYTNTIKTLNANQSGPLTCINGIRVLTIGWVMLGHTYHYAREFDANWVQYAQKAMNNWTTMLPVYGDLSVDTFFAISGLLVSYVMLKKFKSNGGPRKFNWPMFCLHRYLRLTPTYMIVLLIGTVLLPRLLHGPFWDDEAFKSMSYCRETWWTNVLYITNYVRPNEVICMGWSWYMSADLQMYLISPLMIVPLFFNAVLGILLCAVILVAIMVATGVLVYNRNYPVQPFLFPYFTENVSLDFRRFDAEIYSATHMRIGSYIVGILTGYFLYRWKCSVKIPKLVNLLGWFLSFSLSLVLIYSRYSYEGENVFSRLESAIYTAVHRVLWSAVPCWVIFSCATGYGGWINTLLSWKAFVPLSKLTYCVYLVHPLVMMTFYASRMVTTYFTEFEVVYLFLAHTTMSFGVAFLLSISFEVPMVRLEKALLYRGKNNSG